MKLSRLASVSSSVAATRSRREKVRLLAQCLLQLSPADVFCGASYLTGEIPQGKIGLGPSIIRAVEVEDTIQTSISIAQTDAMLEDISATRGAGARARRQQLLASLLAAMDGATQDFLVRLILGELRQGALQGVMTEAIAQAAGQSRTKMRIA